jgi:hypothetical protein
MVPRPRCTVGRKISLGFELQLGVPPHVQVRDEYIKYLSKVPFWLSIYRRAKKLAFPKSGAVIGGATREPPNPVSVTSWSGWLTLASTMCMR